MWEVTSWAVVTWLKLTALLVGIVAGAWLWLGTGSGWFWVITAAAVGAECYIVRQLGREWGLEARLRWWWAR